MIEPPRVGFAVFARNKAPWVAETVRSILAQDYSPMTIYLSDQGSEDGTADIMAAEAAKYEGPNKVVLLDCPKTMYRGMAGLNQHFNWIHEEIGDDNDFLLWSAADDFAHPRRASVEVECWQLFGKPYVGSICPHRQPSGEIHYQPGLRELGPCVVPLPDIIKLRFGGKISGAWEPKLFKKYGPLDLMMCQDLVVPLWAGLESGGLYFTGRELHLYIERDDPNNTGLESVIRQRRDAEDAEGLLQHNEIITYQMLANIQLMACECTEFLSKHPEREDVLETFNFLYGSFVDTANEWIKCRNMMTLQRLRPISLPA